MNDLRNRMHDSVDSRHTDVARLADHAVRAGTTIRRRRRAAVAGSVVAVGALTVGGAAAGGLLSGGPDRADIVAGSPGSSVTPTPAAPTPTTAPSEPPSSDPASAGAGSPTAQVEESKVAPGDPAPQGREIASALLTAVQQVQPGTATEILGQQEYAEFTYTPDDSPGAGTVGVNVQNWAGDVAALAMDRCQSSMDDCVVSQLPNGSRMRVYLDRTEDPSGDGVRSVVERLTPQGVRILASAANGFDLPSSRWDATRPDPVLTRAQLVEVVTQPWWGLTLPSEVTSAELPGYRELPSG